MGKSATMRGCGAGVGSLRSWSALVFAALLLCGCATNSRRVVLRLGHDNPPNHPVHRALERAAAHLESSTGGRVDLQLFPSSQLGTQQEQVLAAMVGAQDLYLAGDIWLAQYYPPLGVLESPYAFRDLRHLYRAIDGEEGERLAEGLRRKTGLRIVDTWYLGRRHVTLRDRAATRPEELRGVKLRSPNAPIYIETVRALGASPTPMGFGEVYLALKTGAIDGQENPLPTIEAARFHEVTRYLVLTGHMITPLAVVIHDGRWRRLSPQDQQAVREALRVGRDWNNSEIERQESELVAKFRREGMVVVTPDVEAFRRAATSVARRFEADWGAGAYERLQSLGE